MQKLHSPLGQVGTVRHPLRMHVGTNGLRVQGDHNHQRKAHQGSRRHDLDQREPSLIFTVPHRSQIHLFSHCVVLLTEVPTGLVW